MKLVNMYKNSTGEGYWRRDDMQVNLCTLAKQKLKYLNNLLSIGFFIFVKNYFIGKKLDKAWVVPRIIQLARSDGTEFDMKQEQTSKVRSDRAVYENKW